MKQRVLIIGEGNKKTVSKPWDFEAMCRADDARRAGSGDLNAGMAAARYLFEGSGMTDGALDGLDGPEKAALCLRVMKWYAGDMSEAVKNV
jgi:hypothetical protein